MPCLLCHSPSTTPLDRPAVHLPSRRVLKPGDALCESCRTALDDLAPPPDSVPSFAVAETLALALGLTVETEEVRSPWLAVPQAWWAFAGDQEAAGDTEEEACAKLVEKLRQESTDRTEEPSH